MIVKEAHRQWAGKWEWAPGNRQTWPPPTNRTDRTPAAAERAQYGEPEEAYPFGALRWPLRLVLSMASAMLAAVSWVVLCEGTSRADWPVIAVFFAAFYVFLLSTYSVVRESMDRQPRRRAVSGGGCPRSTGRAW